MTNGPAPAVLTLSVCVLASLVWILLIFRDVVADLLKSEIRAWLPHLSIAIVRRAARALPAGHHDFLEVWESDLEDFWDRPLTMLAVAIRIARDRKHIAVEIDRAKLEGVSAPPPVLKNARIQKWGSIAAEALPSVGNSFSAFSARTVTKIHDVQIPPIIGCLALFLLVMADLIGMMYLTESNTGYMVVLVSLGAQLGWILLGCVRMLFVAPVLRVLRHLAPRRRDQTEVHKPGAGTSLPSNSRPVRAENTHDSFRARSF